MFYALFNDVLLKGIVAKFRSAASPQHVNMSVSLDTPMSHEHFENCNRFIFVTEEEDKRHASFIVNKNEEGARS